MRSRRRPDDRTRVVDGGVGHDVQGTVGAAPSAAPTTPLHRRRHTRAVSLRNRQIAPATKIRPQTTRLTTQLTWKASWAPAAVWLSGQCAIWLKP